ncbi:MAG: response regulator [Opitutaceae bacterium]|nr:response regulator [Opitutaceae bacterium]
MSTSPRLRLVYLEDDESAFDLVRSLLNAEGFDCELVHVDHEEDYRAALHPEAPDAILSDFNLPTIDGMTALEIRHQLCPATPFIFVSGALGEAAAIDLLKAGVTDFVLKDALPRLIPSIRRCLAEAREHRERIRAEASLRESEARFRRLAENAPDVLFRYRLDTDPPCCEFISPAVERITGYRPAEFYADTRLPLQFVHPDDRPIIQSLIERRRIPEGAAELRWIARDGRVIVTDQRFVPVYSRDGQLTAFEGIARDVTAVKQEAERRRSLETQLFQVQKMESIGTLAGGIAHDFNNILTGILGFTELAEMALPESSPAQSSLAEIKRAGLRAKDLVGQILTFSRQREIQQVPLDLSRAAAEAIKFLRASTPATIQIERRLTRGTIRADPTQIHQIILNLCTNAVHAMRERPGILTIGVKPVEVDDALAATMVKFTPGRYLCLSIADTGHGMDESTLARVFDPFFTTKKPGEGTGLGLPVVQGIVQAHGGGISVESKPGVGSTFRVYFPVCSEEAVPAAAAAPVEAGRGEHILVIDDEASLGVFTGVRLEQHNYRVLVYDDPRQALAVLRANPRKFDGIVTDLTMPQLTGSDLIRDLRNQGIHLPAVIVTGNRAALPLDWINATLHLVVVDKPFSGDDIARALKKVLPAKPALP